MLKSVLSTYIKSCISIPVKRDVVVVVYLQTTHWDPSSCLVFVAFTHCAGSPNPPPPPILWMIPFNDSEGSHWVTCGCASLSSTSTSESRLDSHPSPSLGISGLRTPASIAHHTLPFKCKQCGPHTPPCQPKHVWEGREASAGD